MMIEPTNKTENKLNMRQGKTQQTRNPENKTSR